jgi:hypothetical protein
MRARTEDFERHRSLLFSIAYRMLGSVSEAEDVVQEGARCQASAAGPGLRRAPDRRRCHRRVVARVAGRFQREDQGRARLAPAVRELEAGLLRGRQ